MPYTMAYYATDFSGLLQSKLFDRQLRNSVLAGREVILLMPRHHALQAFNSGPRDGVT